MQIDNLVQIPQPYANYIGHTDPDSFFHAHWSENCDLLLGHVRQLAHKANFDISKLLVELDALAVFSGLYTESDAPKLIGTWLGCIDTAQHKKLTTVVFEPESSSDLYVPFGYWLYRSEKSSLRTLILGWGEATDVLLSVIRLRAQAASTVHQGFEDLVTWLDDLALSKGAETVNPATAEAVRKSFGFDAVDMREALAIAA